jgi:hypothetical protein
MKLKIAILEKEVMPMIHEILSIVPDLKMRLNISKQLQEWEELTTKSRNDIVHNLITNDSRFSVDPTELVGVRRTNLKKLLMLEINSKLKKTILDVTLELPEVIPYIEKLTEGSQKTYNKYFHSKEEICN